MFFDKSKPREIVNIQAQINKQIIEKYCPDDNIDAGMSF